MFGATSAFKAHSTAKPLLQPVFVPFTASFTVDFLGRSVSKENAEFSTKTFAFEFWTTITGHLGHFIASSTCKPNTGAQASKINYIDLDFITFIVRELSCLNSDVVGSKD